MIPTIVSLRFRPGTQVGTKPSPCRDNGALAGRLDSILDVQSFENVSIETPLMRGVRNQFWFVVRDAKVRDAYLKGSQHLAMGAGALSVWAGGRDGVFASDVAL